MSIMEINPNQPVPSIDQIKRWIILSLRWPSLVRWLYWSHGGTMIYELKSTSDTNPIRIRLKILEKLARQSKEQGEWGKNIKTMMYIKDKESTDISSLADENLGYFFQLENERDEKDRLSAAAGQGVY